MVRWSISTKAMILNSESYIISNLAKAYYMSGNSEKAITLYKQAADDKLIHMMDWEVGK